MARPSTEIIEKFHVIEQFQRYSRLLLSQLSSTNVWTVKTCLHCSVMCVVLPRRSGAGWRRSLTCSGPENTPAVATRWSTRAASPIGPRPSWRLEVSLRMNPIHELPAPHRASGSSQDLTPFWSLDIFVCADYSSLNGTKTEAFQIQCELILIKWCKRCMSEGRQQHLGK